MDLDGELPVLREQYGCKASNNTISYTCDHMGMRRMSGKQQTVRLGIWKRINKFAKVICVPSIYSSYLL